jgi:hypothetical protein
MRKIAILFILSLLFNLPITTFAAETPSSIFKMEELSIQVMPEYSHHPEDKEKDHPPLLIGLQGTLMNKSDNPQKGQIEIPIPMKGKDFRIGFIADYNRDQSDMNEIEYEVNKDKGTISWTTSEEVQPGEFYKFVIEYYTNEIKVNQKNRTLKFQFESFADIGLVRVLFLEPLKSENFKLTPAAETHQENGYGMNMFMYQFQGMKPGEAKEFHLEYNRTETKTTVDLMNEMGGKAKQEPLKENKVPPLWVMMAGVGGLTGVLAIVLFLFLKKRPIKKSAVQNESYSEHEKDEYGNERKKLRGELLQGRITEEEYLKKLDELVK